MRKKKVKECIPAQGDADYDPFLRRIQLQGIVIKKMLTEADLLSKPEEYCAPDILHSEESDEHVKREDMKGSKQSKAHD